VLREMADVLNEEGVEIKYAVHPVAGRMPHHMNVLLVNVLLANINSEFAQADVAFVIGSGAACFYCESANPCGERAAAEINPDGSNWLARLVPEVEVEAGGVEPGPSSPMVGLHHQFVGI
jgi:hypothetical protein